MIDSRPTPSKRVRIHSHVTQSRFLHVEDALSIGKIRLFAGNYRRGQGMEDHAHHFIDLADARVIFGALARGEPGLNYREYKGTPPPNDNTPAGDRTVSRVLSVAVKGDKVYVELMSGPGKLTPTGAITPNGKPQVEINVGFKLNEGQRLAATVLAYIRAWDVHRIMVHQQMVSPPAPYLLVSTEAGTTAGAGLRKEGLTTGSQNEARNGNRPVTRKGAIPRSNGGRTADPARPTGLPIVEAAAEAIYGSGDLCYGDGSTVDVGNLTEVRAFQRFVAGKKNAPASKALLQAYYREHMVV